MKTQVIHLDIHDDLISIRDRMAWAKTPRILLVWPRRGRVGVRPLDITLLRRHAESLGAELGIVTRNGEMQAAAREHGISFFLTTADAQKKQWCERKPVRITRRFERQDLRALRQQLPSAELFAFMTSPVRRIAVFAAGVLAVLVVMVVFLPSAEIQVIPSERVQSLTIAVSAAAGEQTVQISGMVPQHMLLVEVEGNDSALATGKTVLADQPAAGEAVLMNLTDKAISVPSGTELQTTSSPPVSYLTGKTVTIPAGRGKTDRVAIHARDAGLSGNVAPGAITMVAGVLAPSLAVTNPAPITGGTEITYFISTEQDRASLRKRLLADLERQARLRFGAQVSNGDMLLPGTLSQTRILEESYNPPAGQVGEKLSLLLRVKFSMGYASDADLHLLAGRVLDASLPSGFIAAPGMIDLKMISMPAEGAGVTRWQMRAERSVNPALDVENIVAIVQGKTASRAASLLTGTHGLVKSAQIKIQPPWWPWLPFLPMRIAVSG